MVELNKQIGERLKKIRLLFNEGGKLSAEQFAFLLGETKDKIINYELGRASVPVRILYELYHRGISPVYIVTGEGGIFADNNAGKNFSDRINARMQIKKLTFDSDVSVLSNITDNVKFEENVQTIPVIRAAAGDIHKALNKKKNEKNKLD